MRRVIILFILVVQLTGCFIAPGMRMKSPGTSTLSAAAFNQIKPNFIPISVALVRQLNQFAIYHHQDDYYYHVGAHDVLNIYVWGHRELDGPMGVAATESGANAALSPSMAAAGYLVDPDGDIFFPMIGIVRVEGKTVGEIRTELMTRLARYIRHPQIDVRVIGFRSKKIYVMGEVVRPGLQPLTDAPMSITDAINLAGGLEPRSADPSHIFIIRGDYSRPDVYWLNAQSPDTLLLGENFRLMSHDVVFVSTAGVARWNRAIEQILPTVQTAWMTYSMTQQFK